MILSVELTNFRQHTSRVFAFSEGLNIIRGANEKGKSSLLEAIQYAFGGARALYEPFEDVVTWGAEPKTLKVVLIFDHAGKTYTVSRSKAGAELRSEDLLVSGQSEVTGFLENLFGLGASMSKLVQVANQSDLHRMLNDPAGAIALIEQLSNLGFIDNLIHQITQQLPCGVIKPIESQIAMLKAEAPVLNLSSVRAAKAEEELIEADLRSEKERASAALAAADSALQGAIEHNGKAQAVRLEIGAVQARIQALEALEEPVKPQIPDLGTLAREWEDHRLALRIADAYNKFESYPVLQGTRAAIALRVSELSGSIKILTEQIHTLLGERGRLQGRLITQTVCGLCGKNLEDVPEVVAANTAVNAQIEGVSLKISGLIERAEAERRAKEEVLDLHTKLVSYELRAAEYPDMLRIVVAESTTALVLSHPAPSPEMLTPPSYSVETARGVLGVYEAAKRAWESSAREVVELKERLSRLLQEVVDTVPLSKLNEDVRAARGLLDKVSSALAGSQQSLKSLDAVEATKIAKYEASLSAYEAEQKQKEGFINLLKETQSNNTLIKSCKEARVEISNEMWTVVLSVVSEVFSSIRGVESVVTKSEAGFLVNGKPHRSLSGSTKDTLGLALRIAVQRTFLPSLDYMILDEPAAGMDDQREEATIARMASVGFRQVLLVTHSSLVDDFATNFIGL